MPTKHSHSWSETGPTHSLEVGSTVLAYFIRESTRAKRKRIVVTPGKVEVVVPIGTPLEGPRGTLAYVDQRRRWIFNAAREIDDRHQALLTQRYASGAKLQFRGRWLMLDVQSAEVEAVQIRSRYAQANAVFGTSKFHMVLFSCVIRSSPQ